MVGGPIDEKDYWPHLEHRICSEFAGFDDRRLRGFWCDGLRPIEYDLSAEEPCVRGDAWCGPAGQERWSFTLLLGPGARPRADIEWAALLPDHRLTGWLSPHPEGRYMIIDPFGGHPGE